MNATDVRLRRAARQIQEQLVDVRLFPAVALDENLWVTSDLPDTVKRLGWSSHRPITTTGNTDDGQPGAGLWLARRTFAWCPPILLRVTDPLTDSEFTGYLAAVVRYVALLDDNAGNRSAADLTVDPDDLDILLRVELSIL